MATVKKVLDKLIRAESNIESDFKLILQILEQEILDLNRDKQLFEEGVGTDGNLLGVYSKATEEMTKEAQGVGFPKRAGEPFNLYNTGSMFKSFDLKVGKDSFSIVNTSQTLKAFSQTKDIPESRIIGLTSENKDLVELKKVLPLLREFFKRNMS